MKLPAGTYTVLDDLRAKGFIVGDHDTTFQAYRDSHVAVVTVMMPETHFHLVGREMVNHVLAQTSTAKLQVVVVTKKQEPHDPQ
ncbi:hypothetical protein DKM44_13020 [Deinococcus irradiatisoli]|uniref:Uncharacterized protein n=1 Tax=Deinococcus irradiatisoli TaxID=2202254 RepID=A0A2Z3JFU2_9DEIO|nr:hypothetical protein [Deinococcus irradiatisoli]AWN24043.1 hypothetical protein DKM44_13020 [Deinococcus irradiatisoli]